MALLDNIKHVLYADDFVSRRKAEDENRNQRGISLIAAAAFFVMSLLNIKQESYMMLATTSISAVFLILGYMISKYKNRPQFLKVIFYIIFIVVFTSYTVMGGNEGFAALWLITATYAVMIAIDFKAGFLISVYYLMMLLLVFVGPFSFFLQYEYNGTFMLRFPFFYAINFSFATYIIIRIRMYQYELLIKQMELKQLGTVDLSTGLMNRNAFIQSECSFSYDGLKTLIAVFIDVNGLHEINNRDGHDAGDRMLCFIANLCKEHFKDDLLYRMGGDEFLILCKNATEEEVMKRVTKLYDAVRRGGYSISYGVEKQESNFDINRLVKAADDKMIDFKKNYYKDENRGNR